MRLCKDNGSFDVCEIHPSLPWLPTTTAIQTFGGIPSQDIAVYSSTYAIWDDDDGRNRGLINTSHHVLHAGGHG